MYIYSTPMATTVARSGDECLKPGIGNWLLNKLLKQTFFWGKKYFFLKFHYIFHYKNFIKSLIFKIFFLPVLPCVDIFHAGTAWVAASVLTTFCANTILHVQKKPSSLILLSQTVSICYVFCLAACFKDRRSICPILF